MTISKYLEEKKEKIIDYLNFNAIVNVVLIILILISALTDMILIFTGHRNEISELYLISIFYPVLITMTSLAIKYILMIFYKKREHKKYK